MSPHVLHRFFRVIVPFFYGLNRALKVIPVVGKPGLGSRVSGEHSFQSGRVNPGYARLAEQVSDNRRMRYTADNGGFVA